MKPRSEKKLWLILGLTFLCLGMAGRTSGFSGKGELKAEIRLKIYNQAIGHFEEAQEFYRSGDSNQALHEIHKAVKTFKAFPEAYQLASIIYESEGRHREAHEQQMLAQQSGISLYALRDRVTEEMKVRQKFSPPPDFKPFPAFLFSLTLGVVLLLGMVYEHFRLRSKSADRPSSLILEPFPDEEEEIEVSALFKTCALLLPAPFIFAFLIILGLRQYNDVIPILIFSWIMVDFGIYLIFFADLSGLGGFRPGGRGPGGVG